MAKYTYTGTEKVIYSFYRDVTDPKHPVTLEAMPGKTYDIEQTTGHQVLTTDGQFTDQELPMPPDENWTATAEPAAAPAGELEPDTDKPSTRTTKKKDS